MGGAGNAVGGQVAITKGMLKDAERMLQSDAKNVRCITCCACLAATVPECLCRYAPMLFRDSWCSASDQVALTGTHRHTRAHTGTHWHTRAHTGTYWH